MARAEGDGVLWHEDFDWRSESVDLCALYRAHFGPCEGEHVLYVGVVTDADGTSSVAEADYDDFELVGSPD